MRAHAPLFQVLAPALALLCLHCDGTQLYEEGEDLGPYAERMPWAEYMATSTMDTVEGVANSGACTTAAIASLSAQIVGQMNCIKPGLMDRIDDANITLTSGAALPYLQSPAAAGLRRATAGKSKLPLNSTLRTLAQQWILYRWYQTGRCGVALAAKPGQSNHEDGLAFDTSDYSSWKGILPSYGFRWFGSSDVVHFDFTGSGGVDARGVLAFQKLWNYNTPGDKIAEDGDYGPETEARIKKSPRTGFAKGPSCK
jgi:hypothetical protein